jgi:hypothetical protein
LLAVVALILAVAVLAGTLNLRFPLLGEAVIPLQLALVERVRQMEAFQLLVQILCFPPLLQLVVVVAVKRILGIVMAVLVALAVEALVMAMVQQVVLAHRDKVMLVVGLLLAHRTPVVAAVVRVRQELLVLVAKAEQEAQERHHQLAARQ